MAGRRLGADTNLTVSHGWQAATSRMMRLLPHPTRLRALILTGAFVAVLGDTGTKAGVASVTLTAGPGCLNRPRPKAARRSGRNADRR
jgi:hypothetical protein